MTLRARTRLGRWLRAGARLWLCALAGFAPAACRQPNRAGEPVARRPRPTEFERDLQFVRSGSFLRIYVFARRDGQAFQPDDVAFLKANSPRETNWWLKTDAGRRVIAGSNFELTPEHLQALRQRFTIEDYTGK